MTAVDTTDLDALVAEASAVLDAATESFVAGLRADSAVSKRGDDFATKVDLAIERQVVDALVAATGSRVSSRLRIHGATGIDLAYFADGILGGAISFGDHVWDHAAGVALVRAAGGIVTSLAGEPWTPESRSALAAAPGVHAQMLEILRGTGRPEDD